MNEAMSLFEEAMEKWNMEADQNIVGKFDIYMSLLLEWNEKINLTAITDPKEIVIQHFMDSLSPLKLNLINGENMVIDVGTGAGFPGIPLKIMVPGMRLVLLDSLRKRTEFLEKVVETLKLDNVEIIHGRAEELAQKQEYRERFDISVSRGVAGLKILSEYCIPFIKGKGYFISYKGPAAEKELEEAQNALKELGRAKARIEEIEIPFSERQHKLVIIQKITNIPKKYPRSPGKVKKSPL